MSENEDFEKRIAAIYECRLYSPAQRIREVDNLIALYEENDQIGLPEYAFLFNANMAFELFEALMDAATQAHYRRTRQEGRFNG